MIPRLLLLPALGAVIMAALAYAGPSGKVTSPAAAGVDGSFVEIFPGVSFDRPLDFDPIPGRDGRYLVTEQGGTVAKLTEANPGARIEIKNLNSLISTGGNEEGLLGLAFDPEWNGTSNRRLYVYYTADGPRRGVLARYNYTGATLKNPQVLLEVALPSGASNHNGGGLEFGPDGMLYLSVGEGGTGGAISQQLSKLAGKVLRLDVSGATYSSPPDNPFVGVPGRDEIFAYGFRNPWRFSWDAIRDELFLGDVGQGSWEEIDIVTSGNNYGWPRKEGDQCISPPCVGFTDPLFQYDHSGNRCAITGGRIYRGSVATLVGRYVFGDLCTSEIWRFNPDNPGLNLLDTVDGSLVSFGIDHENELIAVTFNSLYRFQAN
ncbi:MAG: PQQ-dependent sugar dehydrogenase [Dehalococcoidia bacterium]